MPDYKELYFKLYAKVADLTDELLAVQQELEELYINDNDKEKIIELKNVD